MKELFTIADKGCKRPAIDATAFPNTPDLGYLERPDTLYWSSTPVAGNVNFAFGVLFDIWGDTGPILRTQGGAVRLVRANQ